MTTDDMKRLRDMNTTITLNTATYNKAKACAEEHHMTIDELFVMLINTMPASMDEGEEVWNKLPTGILFTPGEHTQGEIDARFDEIENELADEDGITYEQMMDELNSSAFCQQDKPSCIPANQVSRNGAS